MAGAELTRECSAVCAEGGRAQDLEEAAAAGSRQAGHRQAAGIPISELTIYHLFSFPHHEGENCPMLNVSNERTDNAYIKG